MVKRFAKAFLFNNSPRLHNLKYHAQDRRHSIGHYYKNYLHTDHQGSIIAHTYYNGSLKDSLSYDVFGIPGSENVERFGYTGQIWFEKLGLYHYNLGYITLIWGFFCKLIR